MQTFIYPKSSPATRDAATPWKCVESAARVAEVSPFTVDEDTSAPISPSLGSGTSSVQLSISGEKFGQRMIAVRMIMSSPNNTYRRLILQMIDFQHDSAIAKTIQERAKQYNAVVSSQCWKEYMNRMILANPAAPAIFALKLSSSLSMYGKTCPSRMRQQLKRNAMRNATKSISIAGSFQMYTSDAMQQNAKIAAQIKRKANPLFLVNRRSKERIPSQIMYRIGLLSLTSIITVARSLLED